MAIVMNNINKLNNVLNNFLAGFDIDCTAELGTDFAYFYTKSIAQYALVVSDNSNERFMNFVHSLAPELSIDVFLISWLHEVGHHLTLDDIEDDEAAYSRDVKETLGSSAEDYITYFNLPDEIAATTWAINFIKNNADAVAALWNVIQPLIINIYKDNNLI